MKALCFPRRGFLAFALCPRLGFGTLAFLAFDFVRALARVALFLLFALTPRTGGAFLSSLSLAQGARLGLACVSFLARRFVVRGFLGSSLVGGFACTRGVFLSLALLILFALTVFALLTFTLLFFVALTLFAGGRLSRSAFFFGAADGFLGF